MSTIHVIAHQPPVPTPASHMPVAVGANIGTDGDGDRGIESAGAAIGAGQTVSSNLSHAVHQALTHLQAQAGTHAGANTTATPAKDMPPITMQGFIQALVASLHQIGSASPGASQPAMSGTGMQALAAASGKYAPVPAVSDVQTLIQQSATVLSSNTALQQDFQSMLRAAGIDQSSTSLQHFLRSVSSGMKSSSVVEAVG